MPSTRVAVGAVLIAYNWAPDTDRYRRIAKFIDAFFPRLAEFQKPPRHPKWREANLSATVPGWKRFPAAEEWLKRDRDVHGRPPADHPRSFEQFLARERPACERGRRRHEEREQLFEKFLEVESGRRRSAQFIGSRARPKGAEEGDHEYGRD